MKPPWVITADLRGITRNSPVDLIEYLPKPNAWRCRLINGVEVIAGDEHLKHQGEQ